MDPKCGPAVGFMVVDSFYSYFYSSVFNIESNYCNFHCSSEEMSRHPLGCYVFHTMSAPFDNVDVIFFRSHETLQTDGSSGVLHEKTETRRTE